MALKPTYHGVYRDTRTWKNCWTELSEVLGDHTGDYEQCDAVCTERRSLKFQLPTCLFACSVYFSTTIMLIVYISEVSQILSENSLWRGSLNSISNFLLVIISKYFYLLPRIFALLLPKTPPSNGVQVYHHFSHIGLLCGYVSSVRSQSQIFMRLSFINYICI